MLKLILADNQAIFRAGIAKVLAVEDEMRIVDASGNPISLNRALRVYGAAEGLWTISGHDVTHTHQRRKGYVAGR